MPHQGPYVQPGDTLEGFLRYFWQCQIATAEREEPDFKHPPLPLARIKKVMKSDPEVKMISADAPILFSKACEIFISEVTARAYLVAEQHKRRTLAKADVARALSKSDQFDFLIDIVPREEGSKRSARGGLNRNESKPGPSGSATAADITAAPVADPSANAPESVQAESLLETEQPNQALMTQSLTGYPVSSAVNVRVFILLLSQIRLRFIRRLPSSNGKETYKGEVNGNLGCVLRAASPGARAPSSPVL
ncbi:Nuclear transcription factor Y subunit C-4 [Ceratobasidium theobromae]|uniref:Nuclear transcription factor Y subunit C-4 n=1 Tax=Ceratobasidium theobromae TaxID=1582974 RepID=A0A5N5R0R8_9AGAM|nr:Nuclear transcription factor Y subunit C-4 [Ceratobasidium theobromae]